MGMEYLWITILKVCQWEMNQCPAQLLHQRVELYRKKIRSKSYSWVCSYKKSMESTLLCSLLYKLSLVNFHQLLFLFNQDMRVEKTLIQTLACQLSCNSCSHLTRTWELRKLSYKLLLVNSRATLVLISPGHESQTNSHTNPGLSTLVKLLQLK